jgi:SH3-like domain-containing protein
MRLRPLIWLLALLLFASQAGALEFRSVKDSGSILYDAPALSAQKLFVVSRYYPVEVLSTQGSWSRVRDATGAIAWMQTAQLSAHRMLLVVSDLANVRVSGSASAALAFSVPRNGVLQLLEAPADSWVHVRHQDGSTGYANIKDLWGL